MKIRYMSDLHLEFEDYDKNGKIVFPNTYFSVPPQEDDAETILVLAGDIAVIEKPHTYMDFFEKVGLQFKEVLYVPGNHEYYGHATIQTAHLKLKQQLLDVNVRVLVDESVKLGDTYFYGTTLWTDFNNNDPLLMLSANIMSDYRQIVEVDNKGNYFKLRPSTVFHTHKKSLDKLESFLANNLNSVVITHHLPSFKSVNPMYHGDMYNHFYYSDLDRLMVDYKPTLWFHGHTHESCDYVFFDTRVLCNPRGYHGYDINRNFDPNLFVEI